uniref:Uncharacterized protein n=1 Tax=Anguilla anguilla TaxID=7936 RepID=A0A0E9SS43_ANGAN
MPFRLASVR